MTDAPSPNNTPETDPDYFERIAIEMAQMEFRRNLLRDEPQLFERAQRHSRRHCLEMLILYYQMCTEAIATGPTLIDRIEGYNYLHAMLRWTNGEISWAGLDQDGRPQWRPKPGHSDDITSPFGPTPF